MPGGDQPELPCAGAIQQPCLQYAIVDQRRAPVAHTFAIEWLGAESAQPMWVIDDIDPGGKHWLAHTVLEKGYTARDGRTRDRAGEMAQQSRRDAWLIHHR